MILNYITMKIYTIQPGDFFNRRNLPKNFVDSCCHSGDCEDDVKSFVHRFSVPDQEYLKNFLDQYGAWDDEQLSDHEQNVIRLLWIMAGDIQEQKEFIYSH